MTAAFVLDASVVMAWCFEDEASECADAVLSRLVQNSAVAPSIWPLEVGNALVNSERRGRITQAAGGSFLELLRQLPIEVEQISERRVFDVVMALAREHSISTYDAAYLDLAMQTGLPLATIDGPLQDAAVSCGVAVFGVDMS